MRIFTTLLLLVLAVPAVAQEQEIRNANLPRQLESELLRIFESSDSRKLTGETRIERNEVVRANVAATGGPLYISGRIMGDLAMVGGDVVLESGGSVTGNVTVVGGEVRMADDATVAGTITAYASSTTTRRYTDRRVEDRNDEWWGDRRRDRDEREEWYYERGFSRLTLRTGSSYNRVEGLPIMFGPIIQTGGSNPLRLEALAIWRTESGASLDTDRMGYQTKIEQFLGGARRFSVGGTLYSVVDPMDRWQVSDLEASLATAVFHDDYRDHFDRTGWSAFAKIEPVRRLEAQVEYRREDYESLPSGDPWALFDQTDLWRAQPLVAEGELSSLGASLELDLRDDSDDPYSGTYARASMRWPMGGELTRPYLTGIGPAGGPQFGGDPLPTFLPATDISTDFTLGFLDIRRYNPVGHRSQLNLRLVAAGNVAEEALPPQFQHALGGLGTLPGFGIFHADCGARAGAGFSGDGRFYPSYGCDRVMLGQVEYRGNLSLDFGFGEPDYYDDDWWDDVEIDMSPTWVVFFDAAQGWAYDGNGITGNRDTGRLYDAGVGFLIEDLGIYAALPLNGDVEQEPRFFIRLGRRF